MPNCAKCLEPKTEEEMSKQGRKNQCKKCVATYHRERHARNKIDKNRKPEPSLVDQLWRIPNV